MSENGKVLVAEPPRPIEAPPGYGDWVPIVEMRRVFDHGKTVRVELAIRGREAKAHIQLGASNDIVLKLPVVDWDILPIALDGH